MQAATLLAAHQSANVPDVLCTLLYIIFVVAAVIAVVGLLVSLIASNTRWSGIPLFSNWLYAAAVALIAGLLLLFLC